MAPVSHLSNVFCNICPLPLQVGSSKTTVTAMNTLRDYFPSFMGFGDALLQREKVLCRDFMCARSMAPSAVASLMSPLLFITVTLWLSASFSPCDTK